MYQRVFYYYKKRRLNNIYVTVAIAIIFFLFNYDQKYNLQINENLTCFTSILSNTEYFRFVNLTFGERDVAVQKQFTFSNISRTNSIEQHEKQHDQSCIHEQKSPKFGKTSNRLQTGRLSSRKKRQTFLAQVSCFYHFFFAIFFCFLFFS